MFLTLKLAGAYSKQTADLRRDASSLASSIDLADGLEMLASKVRG
jgi:hypothetical protein